MAKAELPAGVEVGGLGKRFAAQLLDMIVPAVLGTVLVLVILFESSGATLLVVSLAVGVLDVAYLLLVWWMLAVRGAGPGMRLMRLQLVAVSDGLPLGWGRVFLRQLILFACALTGIGLIALVIMLIMHPLRQGWHDLAAGSVVITERTALQVTARVVTARKPVSSTSVTSTVGLPPRLAAQQGFAGQPDSWDSLAGGAFDNPEAAGPISAVPGFAPDATPATEGARPASQSSAPGWPPAAPQQPLPAGYGQPSAPDAIVAPQGPVPSPGGYAPPPVPGQPHAWGDAPAHPPAQAYPAAGEWTPPAQHRPHQQQPWEQTPPPMPYEAPGVSFAPPAPPESAAPPVPQQAPAPEVYPPPSQPHFGESFPPAQQPVPPDGSPPSAPAASHAAPSPVTAVPAAPVDDVSQTHLATRSIARVAGGWAIRLEDGREFPVTGLMLIGRNPVARPGEDVTELVSAGTQGRMVSKTHLAIGLDQRGVFIMDRGSTNGTAIAISNGSFEPCAPGDRVRVRDGQVVSFGDQTLVVRRTN